VCFSIAGVYFIFYFYHMLHQSFFFRVAVCVSAHSLLVTCIRSYSLFHLTDSYFRLYGSLLPFSQEGVESTIYRTKFFAKRRVSNKSLALREPLQVSARNTYRTLTATRSGKPKALRKTGPKSKKVKILVRKRMSP
jgi:hypothetical protein